MRYLKLECIISNKKNFKSLYENMKYENILLLYISGIFDEPECPSRSHSLTSKLFVCKISLKTTFIEHSL